MLMDILIVLAVALEAYLLGSVDTGILVSKLVYHDDVRNHGSGAAGMTNMLRTFGKKAAAMTAAGDVCKGILAVCIGRWLFSFSSGGSFSPYLGVWRCSPSSSPACSSSSWPALSPPAWSRWAAS